MKQWKKFLNYRIIIYLKFISHKKRIGKEPGTVRIQDGQEFM